MNLKHFGDSYDIVKKSLLQWLSRFGPWAAHPMFTHHVTSATAAAFSDFLGLVREAHGQVLAASRLPDARFITQVPTDPQPATAGGV